MTGGAEEPGVTGADHADLDSIDVENLIGRRATGRWERVSVGDLLERVRWSTPDKEAIIGRPGSYAYDENARLTYRQADELANRIAQALLRAGLRAGDRVLFFCENSVEAYVAKFGVAKAGLVCAPINPRIAPDVQTHLLDVLRPAFAFVDAELWTAGQKALDRAGIPGAVIPIGGSNIPTGWTEFSEFIAGAPATEPEVEIAGDDIWEIIPTSGTTSLPKCVMLSHNAAYLNAYSHGMTHTRGLVTESDLRIVGLLPLIYHAADHSHSFPAHLTGGTFIMGRKASGQEFAAAISEERATALYAGSAQFLDEMIAAVAAEPAGYDLTSLTSILWAWAAISPATAAELNRLCGGQVQLVEILGQTEALSSTRFRPNLWPQVHRATAPAVNHVGLPNPLLAAALMLPDGELVSFGDAHRTGEVVYRSPVITAGYYRDLGATRDALRYGWFHSGDACAYDENGLLVMLDRYKDVIKSGGENVSSMRVESIIAAYPGVGSVAVIGVPHPRWVEAVTAVVVPQDGERLDLDKVMDYCRQRLAGYERPKRIVLADDLPVSVGSKIKKNVLREQYADLFTDEPREGVR